MVMVISSTLSTVITHFHHDGHQFGNYSNYHHSCELPNANLCTQHLHRTSFIRSTVLYSMSTHDTPRRTGGSRNQLLVTISAVASELGVCLRPLTAC